MSAQHSDADEKLACVVAHEYEPTEAELEAARDPDIHADRVVVEPELGDAHKTVRERVEKIVDAAAENEVLQRITIEEEGIPYFSVTIRINPLENWGDEGQRGLDTFHVVLGSNGGVSIATKSSTLGKHEYEDIRRVLGAVRRMS